MRLIDADVLPEISLFGTTEYINVRKAPTVPAVPLDRIKEAREEMQSNIMGNHFLDEYNDGRDDAFKVCVAILDKLVAEVEE